MTYKLFISDEAAKAAKAVAAGSLGVTLLSPTTLKFNSKTKEKWFYQIYRGMTYPKVTIQ